MGISMIDVLSSCLVLPWEQRNLFVNSACSFSSQSNFATFRSLSFSTNLSHSVFSKGCLSMSTLQRPNRHSVDCMANKYAAYSNKRKDKVIHQKKKKKSKDKEQEVSEKKVSRKKISRKKRGNSGRKRKRMSKRGKKKASKIVRLVSAAGTGFFYAKNKSRMIIDKLQLLKYDPRVKRHVLFEEVK